jgi:hypothetical protein
MRSWTQTSNFVPFVVNGHMKGEIKKPSGQYLGLICDESLTCRGLNLNSGLSDDSTILSYSCGEWHLLVSWCVDNRYNMAGSDEDLGRSRRPSAEHWGWSSIGRVLGGWMIGRSGDIVCVLYRVHGDMERRFLG